MILFQIHAIEERLHIVNHGDYYLPWRFQIGYACLPIGQYR
jgi:hypothetical protein